MVFYVECSHLDFLYVTMYDTFVEIIRSDDVTVASKLLLEYGCM